MQRFPSGAAEIPEGFPIRLPREALAGLDGLEVDDGPPVPRAGAQRSSPLTLALDAAEKIRAEIDRAGGREVCFLASVDEGRVVREPRAVARGSFEAVLVAARDAPEGGVMLHNHPSGDLEPSDADMSVAAQLYERFVARASRSTVPVATGRFKTRMQVALVNDGPVTLLLDSADRGR